MDDVISNAYTPTILGTHVNGVMRTTFTRARRTNDSQDDRQFTDEQCQYLLLPVTGGRIASDGSIDAPLSAPKMSAHKVCIRSCASVPQSASTNGKHVHMFTTDV